MKRTLWVLNVCVGCLLVGCAQGGGISQQGGKGACGEIKTAQELKAKLASGDVLLVHAFDAENYAEGHIPGAVNIDCEKMKPGMLPKDKGKHLVFYCVGGMCPVGRIAAQRAAEWGYANAWVYSGGMTDWRGAGNKLVGSD